MNSRLKLQKCKYLWAALLIALAVPVQNPAQTNEPGQPVTQSEGMPAAPTNASAETSLSAEKRKEIERLFELIRMAEAETNNLETLIPLFKKSYPGQTEEWWSAARQRMESRLPELNEAKMKIFGKYLDLDDLRALNGFFQSPAGQKYLSALPHIEQETTKAGGEWGRRIGEEFGKEKRGHPRNPTAKRNGATFMSLGSIDLRGIAIGLSQVLCAAIGFPLLRSRRDKFQPPQNYRRAVWLCAAMGVCGIALIIVCFLARTCPKI